MKKTSCQEILPSPLGAVLARFAKRLDERGYRKTTVDQYLSICSRFDAFIGRRKLRAEDIREHHIERFLSAALAGRRGLRQGGRLTNQFWRKPLLLLLAHLRDEGLVPAARLAPPQLAPGLAEYLTFLREHRGFCGRTVNRQRRHVTQFVGSLPARTEDDLRRISIEHVDQHLVRSARRLGRQSIGSVCASLRGFLGHLHMRGILPADLREQVILPHIYPLEAMPRAVAWKEIERTLATIDRSTALGCRDYAILVLIAYCGLRAGDVAALRLGDIDWRRDVLQVPRPKLKTTEPVPLIRIAGEALIAYLHRRPQTTHDSVFLTYKAPIVPLEGPRISWMARNYLQRAGVQARKLGSHTLRHSFAVELLRKGHSLRAIGDALGQHHPQSTFIYAKAAVEDLREVALDHEEVLP